MENLTIVVPFFNGHHAIERLIASIPEELPIIIVDDQSDQPLTLDPNLYNRSIRTLRLDEKGYFSGACNRGIAECATDVLILNQDVWLEGIEWLDLIESNRSRYATIGDGVMAHPAWPNGYVQGTFMYMRRDAIRKVGAFDEENFPLWGATAQWQLEICRAGYEALPVKPVPGFHHQRDEAKASYGSGISTLLKRMPEKRSWLVRTPPLVSVVVPCYKHGRYLDDLLGTLLGGATSLGGAPAQSFKSFEVVIVDDASPDKSWQHCERVADPWKGIRCYRHPYNLGSAATINTAIKNSYGRFITRIDADDMMEPDRLRRLFEAISADPKRVIYDDMRIVTNGKRSKYWPMRTYDFELLIYKNHMHAGIMFSKDAWEKSGRYPEIFDRGREDWAFNIALGINGYCGKHIEYAGYLYRREGQNRTLTNTTPHHHQKFLEKLIGLYPNIYAGDRPMGCCGGRRTSSKKATASSTQGAQTAFAGKKGMVLIEYVGLNAGSQSYFGPVTGTRYVAGGNRRVIYVEREDETAMLELYEQRRKVFKPYKVKAPQAVPEATVVNKGMLEDEEPEEIAPEPADALLSAGEIVALNARDVIAELSSKDYGKDVLFDVLGLERAGKDRVTVTGYIADLFEDEDSETV
jgi:glycosyltransferase involved in cell wall biosynthesis